ncbi:hypothetical protein M758_UG013900 [Ceratodon purpureus]|nr:hypothetical protein M758_UG013900 [Ceratodon purpureus]
MVSCLAQLSSVLGQGLNMTSTPGVPTMAHAWNLANPASNDYSYGGRLKSTSSAPTMPSPMTDSPTTLTPPPIITVSHAKQRPWSVVFTTGTVSDNPVDVNTAPCDVDVQTHTAREAGP